MSQKFFTVLTETGMAEWAKAQSENRAIKLAEIAVGDGNGSPVSPLESTLTLAREKLRLPINSMVVDADNPNWLIIEAIVPANVGGWFVRELGLMSEDGKLLAYGNFPESYKPLLGEGAAKDLVIKMIVQVSNTSIVELIIDPSVVVATYETIKNAIKAHEEKPDAHTQYVTHPELNTAISTHKAEADPHPLYITEVELQEALKKISFEESRAMRLFFAPA